MNNYCFGGKVNEFQHSDKGIGVEKLQYSKIPDKTLTNRYIKAYRKQKRWWQVWKSSFFYIKKTATKGISLSKLPIIFFPALFLKVNQKGLFFFGGDFLISSRIRVYKGWR